MPRDEGMAAQGEDSYDEGGMQEIRRLELINGRDPCWRTNTRLGNRPKQSRRAKSNAQCARSRTHHLLRKLVWW